MTVSPQQAVDLLSDMVRIESVTPWLIPTASGEGALAQFIARAGGDQPRRHRLGGTMSLSRCRSALLRGAGLHGVSFAKWQATAGQAVLTEAVSAGTGAPGRPAIGQGRVLGGARQPLVQRAAGVEPAAGRDAAGRRGLAAQRHRAPWPRPPRAPV